MSHPLPSSSPSSSSRPTARRRWVRWTAVALAVVVVAVGVGRALNKRQVQRTEADAAAARLQAPVVYALASADTVTARNLTLTQTVAISGTVKATQTAALKAKVAGEVQGLQVREGDAVQAGQVLGRVDTTEYQARTQQAEQQAQAAQAQVDIAQRAWANNQALVNQGFISKTALDTSASNLEGAQANHRAALAALDVARKSLSDTALRSPLTGQVAARLVQNGERVGVDARVLELVDLRELELEVALTPADAARVAVGQTATLTVEGLPQPVVAKVVRISPSAQTASRSILAYLKVASVPGLRHGLFANGFIALGPVQGVAVPASAVRNDRPQPYVQWLRPLANATDGAQAEVVHQPVRVVARGQGPDTPDGTGTHVILDSIADNALFISGRAGLFQEKTRVRMAAAPGAPATATPAAPSTPGDTSTLR